MPQQIEVPGMGVVEFPDGMSDAQISAAIQANMPKAAAPTLPSGLGETARVVGSALYGGLTSIPRAVLEAGDWLEKKLPTPDWTKTLVPGGKAIVAADEAIRDQLQPQTETGKSLGRIGEAVVGSVAGPGGLAAPLKLAGIGLGAGVGAEIGGKLTDENPLARLAGGLAGGGLPAIVQAIRPSAETLIRQNTAGMTAADWRRAHNQEQVLNAMSMPHLKSQLLGPSSSLADVVAEASSHPAARPGILTAVRGAASRARSAMEEWKDQHLPVAVEEGRGLMQDIQNVAKQADEAAVGKANAAYRAEMPPKGEVYSGDYVKEIKNAIESLANSPKYGPTTAGGRTLLRFAQSKLPKEIPEVPATPSVAGALVDEAGAPLVTFPGTAAIPAKFPEMPKDHLNNLVKDLNVLAEQEGWKGLPIDDLKGILKDYTPEFDAARQAKRGVMQAEVNPMRQGLAGTIARMGGGPKESKYTATGDIINLVFPADKAQPQAIAKLAQDIGGEQVGLILREHLTKALGKQVENPNLPAKFVDAVASTEAQRSNLEAAIKATARYHGANPAAVRNGLYELLHGFSTYKDLKIAPGVSGAAIGHEAGKTSIGAALTPNVSGRRFLWERASAKTYQKLAEIVTSPEGLKQIEQIARTPEPGRKAALVRGVIAASFANDDENSAGITGE